MEKQPASVMKVSLLNIPALKNKIQAMEGLDMSESNCLYSEGNGELNRR